MKQLEDIAGQPMALSARKVRVKLPWWSWLKFEARRQGLHHMSLYERIRRGRYPGLKKSGRHSHRKVSLSMSRAEYAAFLESRILEKFERSHKCDCGAMAVVLVEGNTPVCLRCRDFYNVRAAKFAAEGGGFLAGGFSEHALPDFMGGGGRKVPGLA